MLLPSPDGHSVRALPLRLLLRRRRGRGLLGSLLRRLVGVDLLLPALLAAERGVASVHEDVLVSSDCPPAPEAGVEVVVAELAGVVAGPAPGPRRRRAPVAGGGVHDGEEPSVDNFRGLQGAGEVVEVLHFLARLVFV